MAKAKQLPSGNWRVRPTFVDEDGVVHKTSITEKTERLANAKALAWQAGIIKLCEQKKDPTLNDAILEYMETLEANRSSPSTIRDYESRRRNSFPLLIEKRISKITLIDVQRQIDARSRAVSPKTVRNDFALLSPVLSLYRDDLNLSKIKLPEVDNEEVEIPSYEEAFSILEASKKRKGLYSAILLAASLGLRRSEICALEWKDIDTSSCTVSITKAMVLSKDKDWIIKQPKKKASRRVIQVEPEIIAELIRNRTDFVRVTDLNPAQVTNEFSRIRDELGLKEIHLHSLRHYKAAVVLSTGLSPEFARRILGHRTDHMVKRVYGHLFPDAKKEAQSRISEHDLALLTGNKVSYLPQDLPRAIKN